MGRVRAYGAIVAIVLFLFGLATPVFSVAIAQGGTGELTWSELSPASVSLAVASLAAWGATLLTRERSVRVFSGVQSALALTALYMWLSQGLVAGESALAEAERIVGIEGVVAPADVTVASHPVAIGVVIGVCVALVASGIAGTISPKRATKKVNRFERDQSDTSSEMWDKLSRGDDPTAR